LRLLAELLTRLRAAPKSDANLLERRMVLYGSNFGDANKRTTTDLPVLPAGGGFRHGQHLTFLGKRNDPLPNLFVGMTQRMGSEADRFASATNPCAASK
jgi:hypothetical protein